MEAQLQAPQTWRKATEKVVDNIMSRNLKGYMKHTQTREKKKVWTCDSRLRAQWAGSAGKGACLSPVPGRRQMPAQSCPLSATHAHTQHISCTLAHSCKMIRFKIKIKPERIRKLAQQVKVPAARPANLSPPTPRTLCGGRKLTPSGCLLTSTHMYPCHATHMLIHTHAIQ